MDYRCPLCREDLGRSKISRAVVARLEIDCAHCGKKVRVNVHPSEMAVVLVNFGTIVVLAVLAYGYESRDLVIVAFLAAMAGALALPLLERIGLRTWPRYAAIVRDRAP